MSNRRNAINTLLTIRNGLIVEIIRNHSVKLTLKQAKNWLDAMRSVYLLDPDELPYILPYPMVQLIIKLCKTENLIKDVNYLRPKEAQASQSNKQRISIACTSNFSRFNDTYLGIGSTMSPDRGISPRVNSHRPGGIVFTSGSYPLVYFVSCMILGSRIMCLFIPQKRAIILRAKDTQVFLREADKFLYNSENSNVKRSSGHRYS